MYLNSVHFLLLLRLVSKLQQVLVAQTVILIKSVTIGKKGQRTIRHLHSVLLVKRFKPGRVAQSVGDLTRKSGVLGSIPGLATYFRFSFRFFKKSSCQLLAKVCARSSS